MNLHTLARLFSDSRPCHLTLVSLFQLGYDHEVGAVEHPRRLSDIDPKPHPVKQPSEVIKIPLQTLRVSGSYQDVICIK